MLDMPPVENEDETTLTCIHKSCYLTGTFRRDYVESKDGFRDGIEGNVASRESMK